MFFAIDSSFINESKFIGNGCSSKMYLSETGGKYPSDRFYGKKIFSLTLITFFGKVLLGRLTD